MAVAYFVSHIVLLVVDVEWMRVVAFGARTCAEWAGGMAARVRLPRRGMTRCHGVMAWL